MPGALVGGNTQLPLKNKKGAGALRRRTKGRAKGAAGQRVPDAMALL